MSLSLLENILYCGLTEIMRKVRIYLHQEPYFKEGGTLYLRRCLTRKDMCQANGCLILVNIGKGDIKTSNENLLMCPSSDFKWKTKFTIVILTKNGFQKFHTFYSKLLSKIWIFIWNLLKGTWKGFSYEVYMPSITIFIKIKQPFAWHIYFLVRHLRRYSDIHFNKMEFPDSTKNLLGNRNYLYILFSLKFFARGA